MSALLLSAPLCAFEVMVTAFGFNPLMRLLDLLGKTSGAIFHRSLFPVTAAIHGICSSLPAFCSSLLCAALCGAASSLLFTSPSASVAFLHLKLQHSVQDISRSCGGKHIEVHIPCGQSLRRTRKCL